MCVCVCVRDKMFSNYENMFTIVKIFKYYSSFCSNLNGEKVKKIKLKSPRPGNSSNGKKVQRGKKSQKNKIPTEREPKE